MSRLTDLSLLSAESTTFSRPFRLSHDTRRRCPPLLHESTTATDTSTLTAVVPPLKPARLGRRSFAPIAGWRTTSTPTSTHRRHASLCSNSCGSEDPFSSEAIILFTFFQCFGTRARCVSAIRVGTRVLRSPQNLHDRPRWQRDSNCPEIRMSSRGGDDSLWCRIVPESILLSALIPYAVKFRPHAVSHICRFVTGRLTPNHSSSPARLF